MQHFIIVVLLSSFLFPVFWQFCLVLRSISLWWKRLGYKCLCVVYFKHESLKIYFVKSLFWLHIAEFFQCLIKYVWIEEHISPHMFFSCV
jgi:hypothetical protein